jgi:hypothetical protein
MTQELIDLRNSILEERYQDALEIVNGCISNLQKKNCSGSVSLPRDLIGSETFVLRTGYANPLPIYKNEMLPR